jgi:RNA polymerase sigma factor (sigma-70 family)
MPTDAELLRHYAESQSEDAFKELVRRHLSMVYFAALRKLGGDVHRAQEVAQDVFVALGRKAAFLSRRPVLTGWLYVSACYAAAKVVRTAQRKRVIEQRAGLNEQLSAPSSDVLSWHEVSPMVDELILQLNSRDREAVLLRFFENHTFSEMAKRLQLTEDGARLRLNRALEKMRSSLAKRGIVSTAVALSGVLTAQAGAAAPGGLYTALAVAALKELATSAVSTAALGIFNLYTMTKSIVVIGGALVLLAAVPTIYHLRSDRNASENRSVILGSSTSRQSVVTAGTNAPKTLAGSAAGVSPRGRAEKSSEDFVDVKRTLLSDLSRGTIRIEALADIGGATPKEAAESFLWAIAKGTNDDISRMLALTDSQKQKIQAVLEKLPQASRADYPDAEHVVALFAAKEGTIVPAEGTIQITSEDVVAGNEIKITTHIETTPEQYKASGLVPDNSSNFTVQNESGGWKVVVPDYAINQIGAALVNKTKKTG